jgi:predicted GNAT family acetyltransferase
MSGNRMIITHTEVPDALRGKGIAEQLVAFAVKYARKEGHEVVAECDYANRFLNRL